MPRSKYRNKRVYANELGMIVDGPAPGATKIADSLKEYRHGLSLDALEKCGAISNLERQKRYELHAADANGKRTVIAHYDADFVYLEKGVVQVDDVKGMRTRMYSLKKKWMLAEYGIAIREV